jgi:hypothetical protein
MDTHDVYHSATLPGGDTHPGPDGPRSVDEYRSGDPATWQTEELPGFGVVFRNRAGTDRETYLAFKSGPNRGHFHGDQLSFHWCANALPIAVDHYCSYKPRAGQEHVHNRVAFATDALAVKGPRSEFITVLYPRAGASLESLPKMETMPGGVRVGHDEITFAGGIDQKPDVSYATVHRGGDAVVTLTGKDIDLDRSQGKIGLFVPDAGYPFGPIPDWLIRQRIGRPAVPGR